MTNPNPASAEREKMRERDEFIRRVIESVCELPDRTSPEDEPDMMLVTGEELSGILESHWEQLEFAPPHPVNAEGAKTGLGEPLLADGPAPITEGPGLGWTLSQAARDKIMELVAENVHNAGALHGIVLASLSVAQPTPDAIAERARREWEKLRPAPFYGSEFRIIEKEEVLAILQRQVAGA